MSSANNFLIPSVVVLIIIYGTLKGVDVFGEFLDGAKEGLKTVLNITPSLVALILAVNMLKSSGALETLCAILSPIADFLGIPSEVMPLTILSPISGSGSLGMFESILKDFGPDSFAGRCASVMMGSTETTFYAITLYYGSVNIKKSRHTLPSALCADFTSFILSPKFVKLFLINKK